LERLGSQETIRVDVRVIAATNKPLDRLVREGRFREDLYYRLKVVTIRAPALRDRRVDIPLLAEYFLARHCREFGKSRMQLSHEALERLRVYHWPGNVRELENCLRQAVALGKGSALSADDLRLGVTTPAPRAENPAAAHPHAASFRSAAKQAIAEAPGAAFGHVIEQAELQLILEALERAQGNLSQAAKLLGIARPTLREKIAKYHIERALDFDQPTE